MSPTRLARSCGVPTCAAPAGPGGRCPAHTVAHRHTANHDRHHGWYRTARWRRLRDAVVTDEPFCRDCRVHLTEEVHHIIRREDDPALFYERTNLLPLCHECHAKRTRRGE